MAAAAARAAGEEELALRRAFDYPYRRPSGSYVFDTATATVAPLTAFDRSGRVAVLAIGSNAAPEQLARKFAPADRLGAIPVTTARLVDHDVVFAARLAAYGACPATLARCDGVVASVHVTWLTPAQLERMDATEGVHAAAPVYRRVPVSGTDVVLDPAPGLGLSPPVVWAYEASAGALRLDPTPWALSVIAAERRVWPARGEREVLTRLAARLGVGDAEAVARTAIADVATRERWNLLLVRLA